MFFQWFLYHVVQQKIARRCGKSRFLSENVQSVRFEALLETSYVFLSKMGRKGKWMNDKATDSSNMTGDHETIRCSQTRMFLLRLPSLFSGVIARSLGTQACVGLQFDLGWCPTGVEWKSSCPENEWVTGLARPHWFLDHCFHFLSISSSVMKEVNKIESPSGRSLGTKQWPSQMRLKASWGTAGSYYSKRVHTFNDGWASRRCYFPSHSRQFGQSNYSIWGNLNSLHAFLQLHDSYQSCSGTCRIRVDYLYKKCPTCIGRVLLLSPPVRRYSLCIDWCSVENMRKRRRSLPNISRFWLLKSYRQVPLAYGGLLANTDTASDLWRHWWECYR